MSDKVWRELKSWFKDAGKVVIAGIGNPIRHDDVAGLIIVQNLQGKVSADVLLVECETVPESCIYEISEFHPTHVLLIDAAFLNLKPGKVRLVEPEAVGNFPPISTHMLPLRIFCDFIVKATAAKIGFLLIEPKNVEFGEGMSAEVEKSVKEISSVLQKVLA